MLMPQTLGENAEITIAYSTVYGGGEVFNGEKKVSLKDVVWGAGDKILYTLLLPGGAENVTFTPDVTRNTFKKSSQKNEMTSFLLFSFFLWLYEIFHIFLLET